MTNKKKSILSIVTVLIILLLGTSIGSSDISLIDTLSIILNKTLNISLAGNIPAKDISIIWKLRLPRVLLAFLVGGCLATGGSVVQSVLKNELASPYTLGVSSGASLGAGLIIVTGITIPVVGSFTLPFVGFVFGLMTVFSVILFSTKIDKAMSNNTIILIGMVLSLFVNALLTTLTSFFSNDLKKIALWQMGSFAMRGWTYVNLILPFFLIGMIGVLRFTKEMDILTFGEEQAKGKTVIFINEITKVSDFINNSSVLADCFAKAGVRIIISGMDSLSIAFAEDYELYDRVRKVNTTYISFAEYHTLFPLENIYDYIRYGGLFYKNEAEKSTIEYENILSYLHDAVTINIAN